MIIKSKYVTFLNVLTMLILTWIAYFAFLTYIHFSIMFNSSASMVVVFNSSKLYLNLVLVAGTCGVIDFILYSTYMNFSNRITTNLMIERKIKGKLDNPGDLPNDLQKYVRKFNKMNGYYFFYILV